MGWFIICLLLLVIAIGLGCTASIYLFIDVQKSIKLFKTGGLILFLSVVSVFLSLENYNMWDKLIIIFVLISINLLVISVINWFLKNGKAKKIFKFFVYSFVASLILTAINNTFEVENEKTSKMYVSANKESREKEQIDLKEKELAEEKKVAEAKKKADEKKAVAEAKKKADEKKAVAEAKKKAEEKKAEEKKAVAEAKKKVVAEAKKKAVAEAKRKADEKKAVAEAKKKAEEKKAVAEAKKKAEEKKAVAEAKKKADEKKAVAEAKKKAEEKEREDNIDIIYYEVFRKVDKSGKFIVEGKYYLRPAHASDMKVHNFEHKGFDPKIDGDSLNADRSLFDSVPEAHDIYKIEFPKGKRDTALNVTLVYDTIGSGW